MSIIRAARPQSNFYILDKRISEDRGLSWAARGLLIFLLGKPDHWKVSVEHLRKETQTCAKPSGRDAIYAMLTELIENGYVKRELAKGEGGTLAGYDYYVFDEPVTIGEAEDSPCTAFPDTAEPYTVEPYTANPTLVRTDSKQVSKQARNESRARKRSIPEDFAISQQVSNWAIENGHQNLQGHLQAFILKCKAKGYQYIDWDSAFMEAIRKDWAGLNSKQAVGKTYGKQAEWDAVMAEFVGQRGNPDDPYTIDMEYQS